MFCEALGGKGEPEIGVAPFLINHLVWAELKIGQFGESVEESIY